MRWAYLTTGLVLVVSTAAAQHRRPQQDEVLHEKFYCTWYMPDNPTSSCCNNADCYPTEIKYVDGNIYVWRREDGKYTLIPPRKVERNRDNPDGRNHLRVLAPQRATWRNCSVRESAQSLDSERFRLPKDLRALPGHPDPAVSWHSGFRGEPWST